MKELLCIGGPCAGMTLEAERRVVVDFGRFEYRKENIMHEGHLCEVMFCSANGEGVIEALLAGYNPIM